MVGRITSPWNEQIVALLVAKLVKKKQSQRLQLPDDVWKGAIERKLYNIRCIWKNAQPQHDPKTGTSESSQKVEERLAQHREAELLMHRRRGRRSSVSVNYGCCGWY